MKELFKEEELPESHLKEIKNFSGAFEFVSGRIDEFKTCISIWTHGGTYKLIRSFELAGKVSFQ